MIGAIAGDIIGSIYEFQNTKSSGFELFTDRSTFTDDTVLTVAVADCILNGKDFAATFKEYGHRFPGRGYGAGFRKWLGRKDAEPYNSYGNGSAMRVSAVGFAFTTLEQVLAVAKQSAEVTHNHPEGIKGAQAVAAAIHLAKHGGSRARIRNYLCNTFSYDFSRTLDQIRPFYRFDETCQGTVPEAITAFLESESYEDAIRKAVSLGGDSDTLACIAGGIAQAYYGAIPQVIIREVEARLDLGLLETVREFNRRFGLS